MFQIKKMISRLLPRSFHMWRLRKFTSRFRNLTNTEIFNRVYLDNIWGGNPGEFNSGSGTHSNNISEYVNICVGLIKKKNICSILDIGCGDFSVSRQIMDRVEIKYTGIDVSDKVVDINKKKYETSDIKFAVLDAGSEEFPKADLITIRQVLQHLSNNEIHLILQKATRSCKYLLITEHLPIGKNVIPNKDKKAGPDIRIYYGSGVFIELAPFNLTVSEILLEYPEDFNMFGTTQPAIIRTSLIKCS